MHNKIIWLLFIFIFLFSYIQAEDNSTKMESWEQMLEKAETVKYEDPGSAVKYINAALDDAKRTQSEKEILNINILLGNAYLRLSRFKKAEQIYLDASKDAEKLHDLNQLNRIYNNLGLVNKYLGNYEKALEYYQKSVKMERELDNEVGVGESLQNIGTMYYDLNKIDLAKKYFIQAQDIFEKHSHKTGLSGTYTNLGIFAHDSGDLETAKKYYEKSLKIDQELNNSEGIAANYNNLAAIYRAEKNYDQASHYYTMALALALKAEDIESVALFKKNIAALLLIKGQEKDDEGCINEAEMLLFEALKVMKDIDFQYEILELYSALGNLYDVKTEHYDLHNQNAKKMVALENAVKFRDKYIQLSDTLFTQESERSIDELEIKYEIDKKQRELEHEKKSNRIKTIFFFVIAFLTLLLFFLTYSRYQMKNSLNRDLMEKNRLITKQKEELTHKNEEITKNNDILEDKHNLLTRIIQNVPNPLFFTDSNHEIIGSNSKLTDLFDVTPNEMNEMTTIDVFSRFGQEYVKDCNRTVKTHSVEYIDTKHGKQYFMIYLSCYEDHNSEYAGDIVLLQNITEIRNTEIALKASEKNLIELNAAKDRLFSIIAHDLKNPLGVLLLSAEMVEKHYEKFDQEKITSMVGQIHKGIKHVLNLLQNLLHWAKTQTGSFKFQPHEVALVEVFREIIPLVLIQTEKKNIDLHLVLPEDATVFVDINMMKTVFLNMVTNAVKFTKTGGQVSVEYYEKDEHHVISIIDTGIGMTRDQINKLHRIDENFVRAGTDNEQGSGLGFLLSKELVSIHQGSIEVKSEPEKGTTVSVKLPLSKKEV